MKEIKVRLDSPYGKQLDMHLDNVRVRCSVKNNEIRIFFGDGVPPVWVPKDSKMYQTLLRQFEGELNNEAN